MKPVLAHYPVNAEDSFFAAFFDNAYNSTPLHYHPEFELVYVVQGSGKRFIGDSLGEFNKGELCLFGPNLPHLYQNHKEYYEAASQHRHQSITIHFRKDSFGKDFLQLPQLRQIKSLLEKSQYGIDFLAGAKKAVVKKLSTLLETEGLSRLLLLLDILNELSKSKEYKLITTTWIEGTPDLNSERLNNILQYLIKNFSENISLQQVANVACLTKTSLCRYFKERTKQSIWDFLLELRLINAARLLRETTATTFSISYESGFVNLSNFNRLFLQRFHCTPREYRKKNSIGTALII